MPDNDRYWRNIQGVFNHYWWYKMDGNIGGYDMNGRWNELINFF